MARYTAKIPLQRRQAAMAIGELENYLKAHGFRAVPPETNTWKKGGLFSNPLFVRLSAQASEIQIEAWVRFLIFPGVHIGEYDLDGFFLMVQKKELRQHVAKLEQLAQ